MPTVAPTPTRDQIVGCIVGGAIGDILGGVPERNRQCLSDDTQLTLATCEALIAIGPIVEIGTQLPAALADAFLACFRRRAITGLGSATLKALRDLDAGMHWALSGQRGERAAGNGAAMRIAPLAFWLDPFDSTHRVLIRDTCRITHHSDEAYLGALAVLIALKLSTAAPPAFQRIADFLPDSRVRDRLCEFDQHLFEAPDTALRHVAAQFGSSGYVVETVPLALLLASRMTPANFESVLLELAQIEGDTDTIGSIAGQIAGARIGFENLPANLRQLPALQSVIPKAEQFADFVPRPR